MSAINEKAVNGTQLQRTHKKIYRHLMPLLIVAYIISFIDRTNIGMAKATMSVDIGLSATAFGLGAGLFFLTYAVLEIPSNLFLTRIGARRWMELRQRMMTLLQEEAELEEIVKMVGMDALSPGDRLKMEAARSIREDFLHQNSFHEIDTYTSLEKQHNMMRLVLAFYDAGLDALKQGADINDIVKLPVREQIGRYKYTKEDQLAAEYEKVTRQLAAETAELLGKEGL